MRFIGAAQFMHQGPAPRRGHQHFGGPGLPVHPGILAGNVHVERMMGMLDHGTAKALADKLRDQSGQQPGLAGAAPARKPNHLHVVLQAREASVFPRPSFISTCTECHAIEQVMDKTAKPIAPLIVPNPADPRLTERVAGTDQAGAAVEINVPVERPLTLYLNTQEIVTMMTIGDYPEYLALGYLLNQNMLKYDDVVTEVEYDDDLQVVVVRTEHHTNFEAKLKKRTQTSGCAQGTAFGDLLEAVESVALPKAELRTSWLYQMTHAINTMPSLYLEAGAIHGCVLCKEGTPVCYTEDVGRHNAVDKIAGWIYRHNVDPADKILYTTGRLTSEMVIKTVRMGIPILVSRSGFTAWGVDLARQVGLTLIGRARGKRFIALAGQERIVYDQNLAFVEDESARHKRQGGERDD